ncbi:hypothetical protein [Nitrincola alkalilacustris]|uniref:hypothetical protein n=1 Tax=Nitrincola alkalilacustris TaxID=1571224 RepID=UPI00124CB2DE|nr:hypothetical protein [Nitrincola alkalilacustris]
MSQFIAVFLVTLCVMILIVLAMMFGKPIGYRPSRESVLLLLRGIEDGSTRQEAWDMFLGYPVSHDPELEAIRRQLVTLHEGLDGATAAKEGLSGYIYDREGRARVAKFTAQLEKLINEEPGFREF